MAELQGIRLKKKYGQHFLRDEQFIHAMIDAVHLNSSSNIFEIGCGDGVLTRAILRTKIARLWVYEIDKEWANLVSTEFKNDKRLVMHHENFLDTDLSTLAPHAPWVLLANLPYQVTFPILHRLHEYRRYLSEGVIMVQEEVAQKIMKKSGRGYGPVSLFFQHYFSWKMLDKVPPSAFVPPPKIFSRLLYFKPIENPVAIPHETEFWQFIKRAFSQPRRTLHNNLRGTHYAIDMLSPELLKLRAQQLDFNQLLEIWKQLHQS